MSSVIIRSASLQDKEAVIKIREDLFGGMDYILSFYDIFVQMENSFPYVAIIGEEIVGFCVAFLVDDMTTLISRAARVSLKHSGRGVFKQLMEHIKTRARAMGASKYRFTTDEFNQSTFSKTFYNAYKHISTKDALCFTLPDKVDFAQSKLDHISKASNCDLETYFTSEKYTKYLFPDGIMTVFWVPYSPRPSNIRIIRNSRNISILTDVKLCRDGLNGIVSIATVTQSSTESSSCNLDIYGSDPTSLERHIKQQLYFFLSVANKPVCLNIYSYCEIDLHQIKKIAKAINLTEMASMSKGETGYSYSRMYLFESYL